MTSLHSVYFQFIAIILIFVLLSLSNEFADSINTSGNNEHHREYINKTIDEQTTTKKTYESPYYKSEVKVDQTLFYEYWSSDKKFSVDDILSKSYRRAVTVELTFDFPFYGYPVRNVTVTSNGFLYIGGEFSHVWVARSQYIAPLMMDFDPTLSNVTSVKYADNGTEFTVIWEKLPLKRIVNEKLRLFTFGVTIYMSGDITFAYRHIPVSIDDANQDEKDLSKIGLSDAFTMPGLFRPRVTIYEYDRFHFDVEDITNNTLIYIAAKPTCLQYTDCEACVNKSSGNNHCMWCTAVQRCSTGYDRKRSEWSENGCLDNSIRDVDTCAVSNSNIEI